jgi:hypothetical protein
MHIPVGTTCSEEGTRMPPHPDHSASTWLIILKNLEGQTDRWIQCLQEYNFTYKHCQGKNQQCSCPFAMTMPTRVYSLPQSLGAGRHQIGSRYCCISHSSLGSNRLEKGATQWPGQRAHSGGSRIQTAHRMERHHQTQPHIQKLWAQWKSLTAGNDVY